MLEGVNVALGVTGSIAAVKVVELAHELRRQGAEVRGVMTESARGIVHPWSLQFATDRDVVTEITGAVEHVDLCGRDGWADVLLVAPATANTVGKMANGVDDSTVTTCATTAFGAGVPVVVAPAMHEPMYDHPGVAENLDKLREWGVSFAEPRVEEGKAKIATEEAIVTAVARATTEQTLAGRRVVVTSGGTAEPVDPVRTLSNRSSGKTGRAVARACHVRGADVTLVHGAVTGERPDTHYADTVWVETAAEMREAVLDACAGSESDGTAARPADALISAAAISDYTVEEAPGKIRSGQEALTLELVPTPKLLDTVSTEFPDVTLVGFKAETDADSEGQSPSGRRTSSVDDEALTRKARAQITRVGCAFVVANDASVMGAEETRALLVRPDTADEYAGPKAGLGARVAEELARELD